MEHDAPTPAARRRFVGSRRVHVLEHAVHAALFACATVSVLTTAGIVAMLLFETWQFFQTVSLWEFLTGTQWSPLVQPRRFGVLPLVCGTLWIAFGAGCIAIPTGLLAAVYLSEYATPRFRDWLKPVLEILAGIPSVVYGYFAVVLVSPVIRWLIPSAEVFNVVSASIVVGIMVVPVVISMSADVLQAVPRSLREAAYALGSDKLQVTTRVVVPAAMTGVLASFILAVSRAIGETMAVTLAAGARPRLTWNPLHSIQTMTAYIVQVSLGDVPTGSIEYQTIFAVCMALFVITLVMNVGSQWILARFAQKYE